MFFIVNLADTAGKCMMDWIDKSMYKIYIILCCMTFIFLPLFV